MEMSIIVLADHDGVVLIAYVETLLAWMSRSARSSSGFSGKLVVRPEKFYLFSSYIGASRITLLERHHPSIVSEVI